MSAFDPDRTLLREYPDATVEERRAIHATFGDDPPGVVAQWLYRRHMDDAIARAKRDRDVAAIDRRVRAKAAP